MELIKHLKSDAMYKEGTKELLIKKTTNVKNSSQN